MHNYLFVCREHDPNYLFVHRYCDANICLFTEIVMALIDAAFDKDLSVRSSIQSSLHSLGKKKPALVLSSCLKYLNQHAKVEFNAVPILPTLLHTDSLWFFSFSLLLSPSFSSPLTC